MTATLKLTRHQWTAQRAPASWDATRCLGLVIAVILFGLAAYLVFHDARGSWPGSDLPLVAFARTALTEATA